MTAKPAAVAGPVAATPAAARDPAYRRILLKLSGEALMGDDSYGINREVIDRIVAEIAEVTRLGVEVAIVIGGGNIFRGVAPGAAGMDRATADYMGMLATLMNALALQDALRRASVESRVQSALRIDQVASPTSAAEHCATSRSARSSSSPPAPGIRFSRRTPQPLFAAARWASTSC